MTSLMSEHDSYTENNRYLSECPLKSTLKWRIAITFKVFMVYRVSVTDDACSPLCVWCYPENAVWSTWPDVVGLTTLTVCWFLNKAVLYRFLTVLHGSTFDSHSLINPFVMKILITFFCLQSKWSSKPMNWSKKPFYLFSS